MSTQLPEWLLSLQAWSMNDKASRLSTARRVSPAPSTRRLPAGGESEMRRLTLVALAVFALLVAYAPPALAGPTFVVDNDRAECRNADFMSIQAAVTAAPPGSTILVCTGTYHESVNIPSGKNDIRLLAKGAPGAVIVDADHAFSGIHLNGVTGVLVEGFDVIDAHEADILLSDADGNRVRKNRTSLSGHDGIQLRTGSSGNVVEHNVAFNNMAGNACGINLITGSSHNIIRHNLTFNNQWGIQIAAGALNNVVFHNESRGNRDAGLRNIAASNGTMIENNRVFNNAVHGIRITTGSSDLFVARNHVFGHPVDIFWDMTGINVFENNHCNTSVPPGLCEHDEGQGH